MSKIFPAAAGVLFVCVLLTACTPAKHPRLTALLQSRVVYQCENEVQVVADYYALEDSSLHFVKLILPNGDKYTLPNVLSASGVRYTDDIELLWWTKGDTAFAQRRDQDLQWQSLYVDCRVIRESDI